MKQPSSKTPSATKPCKKHDASCFSSAIGSLPLEAGSKADTDILGGNGGYIDLIDAELMTGVPYDTLNWATENQRLATKNEKSETSRRSKQVHVLDLAEYMISHGHWKPILVDVSKIHHHPDCQPRTALDRATIADIKEKIEKGGAIEPVWLIRQPDGRITMNDGHHREVGTVESGRERIRAIILEIPFCYAKYIARTKNQTHGNRLTARDYQKILLQHLASYPEGGRRLVSGALSQARFARILAINEAALCRALEQEFPIDRPPVATVETLPDLAPLFDHLGHRQPDDRKHIATILARVCNEIVAGFSETDRRKIASDLKSESTALVRGLPDSIRTILHSRGGNIRDRQAWSREALLEHIGGNTDTSPETSPTDTTDSSPPPELKI